RGSHAISVTVADQVHVRLAGDAAAAGQADPVTVRQLHGVLVDLKARGRVADRDLRRADLGRYVLAHRQVRVGGGGAQAGLHVEWRAAGGQGGGGELEIAGRLEVIRQVCRARRAAEGV